ncbi:MAG: F0F1 ATP synthase subunit A [Gemmataceae bacterium]|nr:F0F1 ATP synthase subunit A [Gemmataceae bacterium]
MLLADAFDHVVDSKVWEFFETQHMFANIPYGLSKFIILQLLAAGLIILIFVPLSRQMASGAPPKGIWNNCFESLLTFIRERVVKPTIGEHDCDTYVPFFWTLFLYILFNNLLGMIPFCGSATASLAVTGTLAIVAFFAIHGSAVMKQGIGHYIGHHFPHIDAPKPLNYLIGGLIFGIEILGHFIKAFVLSVRLFANMFAGHMVLAFILSFIVLAKNTDWFLFWPIGVGSSLLIVALSLLEIFVAFLQAFVFTYLTALFMGSALHPAH